MGRERNLPEHFPSELTLGCRVSAGKGLRQGSSSSLSRPLAPPGPHGPLSPRVQACLLRLLRGPLAERKSYLVQLGYGSVDLCPGPWDSWIPKPPSHEQAGRAGDLGPWLLLACCRGGKAHSGTGDLPARPSGLTTPPPRPAPPVICPAAPGQPAWRVLGPWHAPESEAAHLLPEDPPPVQGVRTGAEGT